MRLTIKKTQFDNKEYVKSSNGKTEEVKYNWAFEGNTIYYSQQQLLNKLGQLEDIEDELGIDLITLISILKANKVYLKGSFMNWDNGNISNEIKEYQLDHDKVYIHYTCNYFELITHWEGHKLNIKDYGKTWALTPEELL